MVRLNGRGGRFLGLETLDCRGLDHVDPLPQLPPNLFPLRTSSLPDFSWFVSFPYVNADR